MFQLFRAAHTLRSKSGESFAGSLTSSQSTPVMGLHASAVIMKAHVAADAVKNEKNHEIAEDDFTASKTHLEGGSVERTQETKSTEEIFAEIKQKSASDLRFRQQYENERAALSGIWEKVKKDMVEETEKNSRCPHKHHY